MFFDDGCMSPSQFIACLVVSKTCSSHLQTGPLKIPVSLVYTLSRIFQRFTLLSNASFLWQYFCIPMQITMLIYNNFQVENLCASH